MTAVRLSSETDNQTVGKAKIPALTEVGMDPGPMEIATMLP